MLTQTMPALIDALRQVLPPEAIGPLAQALGNCGQPLSHRAGVNFAAPQKRNANGTYGGNVYGSNSFNGGVAWNPASYQNLFPGGDTYNSGDYQNQVDIGGMNVTWNAGNRYDSQFYFPTNQVFQQNQYYGGPTINIDGGARIDYITNQTFEGGDVTVENVTTQVLNGDPVAGPVGPPGAPGKDGQRGAPGAPGGFFGALPPGFFGPIRYLTGRPFIRDVPERVARAHRYIQDAWIRGTVTVAVPTNAISGATVTVDPAGASVNVPTDAISGGTLTLSPEPVAVTVPLTLTFDPETCSVSVASTTTFYAFPTLPSYQTLSGTAASSQTVTYATTATVTATVTGISADTVSVFAATTGASTRASVVTSSGFVVKGADADFWQRTPASVVVSREPKLIDANPAQVRVYQQ
jgi:hypothetical protein